MENKEIKDGMRLYINITNHCNLECPFCCMYSSPKNFNSNMNFETFKHIIDTHKSYNNLEVQIEGGEPTTNQMISLGFFLFVTYALEQENVSKVIILSNGTFSKDTFKHLVNLSNVYKKRIEMKISINYWIIKEKFNNDITKAMKFYDRLIFLTKYLPYFSIKFNTRLRLNDQDKDIENAIKRFNLDQYTDLFNFQSYGRLMDSIDYKKPIIKQNIKDWKIYSHDGICFFQDLIVRSEYEGGKIK